MFSWLDPQTLYVITVRLKPSMSQMSTFSGARINSLVLNLTIVHVVFIQRPHEPKAL